MAKIDSNIIIDWLSGNDEYDKKTLEAIVKKINKDKHVLFSIIKWGGSTFECWEKADNPLDSENLILSEYKNACDFGWDNDEVFSRFLSVVQYEARDITKMIESVNDGTRPKIAGILLELQNKYSEEPGNTLDYDQASVSKKEAKEIWKFQMDNELGGYKITGLSSSYGGNDQHLIMPSYIDDIPVITVADNAFKYSRFETIQLSENLKTIGSNLFHSNGVLTEVIFPDDLEELPKSLFTYCTNLRRVHLPKNVKKINPWAFGPKTLEWGTPGEALPNLEEIWIDPSNEFYETDNGVLIDKKKHTIMVFPAKIQEYRVPENVKKLTGIVFAGSQLKHIYIHDKVKSMGDELFVDAGLDMFDEITYLKELVIHAPSRSFAIEYAKEKGIKYIEES